MNPLSNIQYKGLYSSKKNISLKISKIDILINSFLLKKLVLVNIITILLFNVNFKLIAGSVSGCTNLCVGTSGNNCVFTASGFTNPQYYQWFITAPGATPASATTVYSPNANGFMAYTNSNTLNILFPANINTSTATVQIVTAEGSASLSVILYKPLGKASDINGPKVIYTNIPSELTDRKYSIAPFQGNSVTYVWVPPSGATLTTNKNEASVTFSSSFTGGTIRAFGVNGPCGSGEASTLDIEAQLATLPPAPLPAITYVPSDQLPNPATRDLTSKPVGSMPGSINVGSSGSASYSFPIISPPGTAGMQPDVSIFYNSNAGVGLLGLGWNLSATSVITRTGKNYYFDGKTEGINFDATDKYTLDGNPLIAVNGTYGYENTEYRTEYETFSKIISTSYVYAGFGYFIVETKDGRTMEYGNTPDSKIEAQGRNVPMMWYLNKVTDKFGNYIKYNYFENSATGEVRLSSIEFTGNVSQSLAPYNKIEFIYATKSDPGISYIKGSKITNNVVLQNIKVFSESVLVREYLFNYTMMEGTRLVEAIEKAADGTAYNSTVVNWMNKPTFYGPIPSNYCPLSHSIDEVYGDFNGDGRKDLVKLNAGTWTLYLVDQYGFNFTQTASGTYNLGSKEFKVADFNGDGLDDLLEQYYDNASFYSFTPLFSTGTGFNRNVSGQFTFNTDNEIATGDFNGDGLIDCFIKEANINKELKDWKIYSCSGTGHNSFVEIYSGNNFPQKIDEICYSPVYRADGTTIAYYRKIACYPLYSEMNKVFIDFNGDGKTDLMGMDNERATFYNFDGTKFIKAFTTATFNASYKIKAIGNFNGDSNIDFLVENTSSQYKIIYTTGAGAISKDVSSSVVSDKTGDFNGDGLIDFLKITHEGIPFYFYVSFNNGDGFNDPVKIATTSNYSYISNIGDFDGDGVDDIYHYTNGTQNMILFSQAYNHRLVGTITNGLNQACNFAYKPLTNNTVYTKGTGVTFPVMDYQGPMYVVSSAKTDNGLGGQSETQYTYNGMKIHRQGKGGLGFTKTTQTNAVAGIIQENTFGFNTTFYYPYILKSLTKTVSNTQISVTDYTNTVKDFGNKRIFPYTSLVVSNDLLHSITQTSAFGYDDYGNQTSGTTNHSSEGTTTVTNTFINGGSWCLSKPETSTVTKIIGSETPFIKSTRYTYYPNGQLYSVLTAASDPGTDDKKTTTTYEYNNPFGLNTKVTSAGDDVTVTPYVFYEYDAKGRFLTKTTNALSQSSETTYDGKTGNVLTSKDINGLQTTNAYDIFGRTYQTTQPDGNTVTLSRSWSDAGAPTNAVYYTLIEATGSNPVKTYFDRIGRALRQVNKGFNGSEIYSDSKYNTKGQLYLVSDPYFPASTPEWTTYGYDVYGRSISISAPTGNATIAYNGRTTTKTNTSAIPQQSSSQTVNAMGQLISASDAGGAISYTYYSSGLPKTITAPGNAITSMEYDKYGNQTRLIDPNAGTITYSYNAFHQLTSQVKNGLAAKTSTLTYDVLGRLQTLTEYEGTTTYTYDTKTYGIGKLANVTAPGGISEDYTFDNLGRLSSKTEIISGQSFTESLTYDTYSRLSTLTYPSGFAISYNYNTNNYLSEIKRTDDNTAIWTAQIMNVRGQVEQFKSGNNLITTRTYNHGQVTGIQTGSVQNLQYSWDMATGNLTWRKDANRNLTENFTYDNLDRLTSASITGGAMVNFTFNNNGNIETSTPAGAYTYDAAKPHAVATVTNPNNIVPTIQQTVNYTSFDKVSQITEGTKSLTIAYGSNKERKKMVVTEGSSTLNRYYAHGNYEKETGSMNREMHYISGGTGVVAIYEKKNTGNGNQMYYIHKDHQGSVNVITNQSGTVVEEMNFDAWGRRRNPTNWTYTGVATTHVTDRGYTGHEHLDQFGIINMNGRVYDPVLGRFLSPDMVVQAPGYTQSYNRYSYCFNNPLKYTDPSGWYGENSNDGTGEFNIIINNLFPNNNRQINDGIFSGLPYIYITSVIINEYNEIIEIKNDGDPHVYLAKIGWKPGDSTSGLTLIGYMDPDANYRVGQKYQYYGPKSPGFSYKNVYRREMMRSLNAEKYFLPSTFLYKNGETFTTKDGTTYKLFDNKWIKLSGTVANLDGLRAGSTGYIPSYGTPPNMVDAAIVEEAALATLSDALQIKDQAVAWGVEMLALRKYQYPDPTVFGLLTIYNAWDGAIQRVKDMQDHDNEVKKLRR